ncbi:bifunctional diaminohydroxyphosphoribosylaminopyrimidine deaminase/5-amino-6-(5-phosphoribosylamino)uracil reductase RibD [Oceanispirochaeta sp. M2]|nr:bifunctional diaminohydroxyphosphoribosylaminopyrimidine deaminase/5-amino-6-(5-phosphoribosylamino)uracil reductase RibD [Oceanispirochaeta sp. M2]NPD74676.1 bifunctional diaminohydroxyphosphoribosylaminopyrimidine deaminase/5-amino-6-(5-phosphoribosylamino)uracil reductase RibD [Oceanispirochaeta sp. M1]RDG29469.1 bifunctional diaminohydroxyphosphoribosylaminopyrimidine deaminase/5-amino-6-(5-phosphoribosylamino)uracil reductase RibD [Oceanispirochaeta sp. M1]
MKRALYLSEQLQNTVLPNPMVGAVIVRDGKVLGEGLHENYGGKHAEENALIHCRINGYDPAESEMYVTLEPCSFSNAGKHNGPCTEKIIAAGIKTVVIARADPNPLVRGAGIRALRDAGIAVEWAVLEEEAARLNRIYEVLIQNKRPYIHLKAAITMDGFIAAADNSSKWISGPESRKRVMEFRRESDAVLVGRRTFEIDSPSLSVHDEDGQDLPGPQPEKIVISRNENPEQSLEEFLLTLRQRGLFRILVEGGREVFNSFLKAGYWDRLTVFQTPDLLGRGVPFCGDLGISGIDGKMVLEDRETRISGRDIEIDGYREGFRCLRV